MKLISVYSSKGGVGKSSNNGAISYELASLGKVLVIDGDKSGNLTRLFVDAPTFDAQGKEYCNLLNNTSSFDDNLLEVRAPYDGFHGIYLLGTSDSNNRLERYIDNELRDHPTKIKQVIKEAKIKGFEYIIYDLPADWSYHARLVLSLCDEIIPIIEPEPFAMEAFWKLLDSLEEMKVDFEADFKVRFAICNKFDKKMTLHNSYLEVFNGSPFAVFVIKNTAEIPGASSFNMVLQEYRATNVNVQVYKNLVTELTTKEEE